MAAMNSQAIDQNSQRYNEAAQATNAAVSARGENGMTPMSGVAASGYGNLQAAKAGDLANSLRTNTLNNAQQALANQQNAAAVLSGNAQTQAGNVGTYGSGAANALSNVTQAQGQGFMSQLGKGLGAGIGGGLTAAATGGFGTAFSGLAKGLLAPKK